MTAHRRQAPQRNASPRAPAEAGGQLPGWHSVQVVPYRLAAAASDIRTVRRPLSSAPRATTETPSARPAPVLRSSLAASARESRCGRGAPGGDDSDTGDRLGVGYRGLAATGRWVPLRPAADRHRWSPSPAGAVALCVAAAAVVPGLGGRGGGGRWRSRPGADGRAGCGQRAVAAGRGGDSCPGPALDRSPVAVLSRAACLAGGVLVGATALSYQRHWRGACLACGRTGEAVRPARPPRWAWLAAGRRSPGAWSVSWPRSRRDSATCFERTGRCCCSGRVPAGRNRAAAGAGLSLGAGVPGVGAAAGRPGLPRWRGWAPGPGSLRISPGTGH